jgi:membrane protease YdiL (CAAX protease family)
MIAHVKNFILDGTIKHVVINFILKIIRSAPIFILLCIAFSIAELFLMRFFSDISGKSFNKNNMLHLLFFDVYTVLCLLALPLLFNAWVLKFSIKDLGIRPPVNIKSTIVYGTFLLLIVLPVFYYIFMTDVQMKVVYAIPQSVSLVYLIFLQLFILPIYYFCEEFFFRGFFFMYLWKKIGWHSYWITEITFMFAHAGKPMIEIWVSFPVGILLNFLTLKTRSIYPAVVVHTTVGMMVNMLGYLSYRGHI